MTTSKVKNYWIFNGIAAAIVFVCLVACFCWEVFVRKMPTEPTWTEEVIKYVIAFPALVVVVWTVFYAVFLTNASRIAEKEKDKLNK